MHRERIFTNESGQRLRACPLRSLVGRGLSVLEVAPEDEGFLCWRWLLRTLGPAKDLTEDPGALGPCYRVEGFSRNGGLVLESRMDQPKLCGQGGGQAFCMI